LFKLFANALVM